MAESDKKALLELWRNRVEEAKLRLDFARAYVKELQHDFSSGELPSPDGHYAFEKALRAETAALAEFSRVVRTYTDLVLQRKPSGETESPADENAG